jgi:hypothetical protein
LFVLAGMLGATGVVLVSAGRSTSGIVVLSVTVVAASLVAVAAYRSLAPLMTPGAAEEGAPAEGRLRAALEREKALVLRTIKELEFDHAMRKISTADFEEMRDRLKVRAAGLIQQLDVSGYRAVIERDLSVRRTAQATVAPAAAGREPACASCETTNDADARFCKQCGAPLPEPA